MKILNQKLITVAAAVLLTSTSLMATAHLSMAPYEGRSAPAPVAQTGGLTITNLPEIIVRPSASERRSANLAADSSAGVSAGSSALRHVEKASVDATMGLLGSQLAMPYYSFGNAFGRISKE